MIPWHIVGIFATCLDYLVCLFTLFISHLFNEHIILPGTLLGARNKMVKKIGMISVLMKKMGGTNKEENRQLQYNLMSDIMRK